MTSTLLKSASLARSNFPTVCQFSHGLTIIAEQVPVEAVNLSLWLNVGSAVEPDEINGIAHFLEHMIFKGTARLQSGEFERLVEERGAITNAATSQDYTHYYITTAPRDFADLAPLQIEVVCGASIPDAAFEAERQVVLEEIRRSQDNPRRRHYQRLMEIAFEQLPYRRPVLGSTEVVGSLTPHQMRDFHRTWYQPSAMTAVVVGNLPADRLVDIVAGGFDRAQSKLETSKPLPLRPTFSPEAPYTDILREEYLDDTLQQARLTVMWRVPGMESLEDTYALDVLATILGQGRTSRLTQDLREVRGLVSRVSASNMTHQHQGLFSISAQLPAQHLSEVEAIITHHLRLLQQEPVTEAEIQRIRSQVANRFVFGNETPSDRAGLYGYYQSMVGNVGMALSYPERIQAVTAEEVQGAVQRYLSPDACAIVIARSQVS